MYLAEVRAENFRIYGMATNGPEAVNRSLSITFDRGLNVLVGENDSGKTAIIDAIRLCLLTTAMDTNRITIDDFHCHDSARAETFTITCVLRGLTTQEKAQFVELLTSKDNEQALYVTLRAELIDPLQTNRVAITVRTGEFAEGPHLDGAAREMLKATYLRPLRDAEGELRPGRNSRLSQVLAKYPKMTGQDHNDFDETTDEATTLVQGRLPQPRLGAPGAEIRGLLHDHTLDQARAGLQQRAVHVRRAAAAWQQPHELFVVD